MTREQILRRDPATPLWLGTVVWRLITFIFAASTIFIHADGYQRPWLAWTVLGVMVVWTAFTTGAYLRVRGRRAGIVIADLVVCCTLMSTSPWVLTPEQYQAETPLITTLWVSSVPIAAGVIGGWLRGAGAGLIVSAFTVLAYRDLTVPIARDMVQLIGVGLLIGMSATQARTSAERLARSMRAEAALAERERLARSIHDGVLQVLARVRRRGHDLGGEAAELARLAGEQETALRTLVSAAPQETAPSGDVDLGGRMQLLGTERVQVSVPAEPVLLPADVVAETLAVVNEALSNVEKHAGPQARAWLLLEELPDTVVVSVRDDGPGIPDGRIQSAAEEGRMGIAKSMHGRITELGGTLTLETAPGAGTEWEFRLPRTAGRDSRR